MRHTERRRQPESNPQGGHAEHVRYLLRIRGRSLGSLSLSRDDAVRQFTVMNSASPNVMISAMRKVMI